MKFNYSTSKHFIILTIAIAVVIFTVCEGFAADIGRYRSSSVLSKGKWVKIDVTVPGLQTLSRQTLKNLGFNDPKDVYVYGYGGRMISETLDSNHPDDLPPVPIVRKEDGSISFFATGNIAAKASSTQHMKYDHYINPYGDTSYYFLSDVEPDYTKHVIDLSKSLANIENTFTCQIVYERDLLQCATSGRDYLGEDFKSTKKQSFSFDLPDNAAGDAMIRVRFGANTTGAPSSFIVSANGARLPATHDDQISAVTSSDQYYRVATSTKIAEGVGNSLTIGIEYSQGGVVNVARLDWIEVEYERNLTLRESRLHFIVNPSSPTAYRISGASEQTILWDVTKPWQIKEVKGNFNQADKTLTIGVDESGMREFFAFDPSATGAMIPGGFKIANQDIHGMPTPDMVIISPEEYASAAERIADVHRIQDRMTVYVLSPEKIFNEFSSGNPDVSAFRKLLKMWYDRSQIQSDGPSFGYCLLMGRPTFDQKARNPETRKSGYPRNLIWQSPDDLTEASSYNTDDFIAMLEDETSERSMASRKLMVGVGRYTVTSAYEAEAVAAKLENYTASPVYGLWRNNVMVVADDGDNAQHLDQAQSAISFMMKSPAGRNYAYDRIYLDAFERKQSSSGPTFPAAKQKMLRKWQTEGVSIIFYVGHANPKEWTHEKLLTWNDINNMSNQYLPVLYAATCSFGKWDAQDVSGAEHMLTNPSGGVIAAITPSRTVYINKNGYITNSISQEITSKGADGKGKRLGDIVRIGKNLSSKPDDNLLRYHLFGDPALRMPVASYTVQIDSIGGKPVVSDISEAPILHARSSVKISGHITDNDGKPVAFNGPVQYTLFDAETSIQTHGWGESGVEKVYQDRTTKLATGRTTVEDGKWSTSILMPSEISNNFSPALITMYAYDDENKIEANGSTGMLYVYGYENESAEDSEGPLIERFVVGDSSISTGTAIHSDPVAVAVFSDESGINISDAGIGHNMTLMLDSRKKFDDVNNYFTPDPFDKTKGSIAYPLINLQPGEHRLTLTVWDNANNSSSETIDFKVGLNIRPVINELTSFYSRESDRLTIKINTDRALRSLICKLECFDLSGNLIWNQQRKVYVDYNSSFSFDWNLSDSNGNRLQRGIYSLRATITSDDGLSTSKSKKIAIPAK